MIPPFANVPTAVQIVEVGPRDGLQNEKVQIPTAQKIQFIQLLAEAGLSDVEATSFVSPRSIPQLSDADAVMTGLTWRPSTTYPALLPHIKVMYHALPPAALHISSSTSHSHNL